MDGRISVLDSSPQVLLDEADIAGGAFYDKHPVAINLTASKHMHRGMVRPLEVFDLYLEDFNDILIEADECLRFRELFDLLLVDTLGPEVESTQGDYQPLVLIDCVEKIVEGTSLLGNCSTIKPLRLE